MDILKSIEEEVVNGNIEEVKNLTQAALDKNFSPMDILNNGLVKGMERIGKLFECQEVFVPEILLAAMAMKEGLSLLKPFLEKRNIPPVGKMVIGTVEGDVHDIGKNIVSMMFAGAGFDVIDLGNDVPAKKFLEVVEREKPDILALSCLMTPTRPVMKEVIQALEKSHLRDRVKVLIGGAPINQNFSDTIGADGFAPDPTNGVRKAMNWLRK